MSSRRASERRRRAGADRPRGAASQGDRACPAHLTRLRGRRARPRRCAEGRHLLHGRPRAPGRRPVRTRLHGRLQLRVVHGLLGRGAHPQGSRRRDRGQARDHRGGHRRLRPHAQLPDEEPALAQTGLAGGVRPAHQARPSPHPAGVHVRRLRDPRCVRGRLRARPGRAIPHPRVHRHPARGGGGPSSGATVLCRRREGMLLSKCQGDLIRVGARRRPARPIEGQA